METQTTTSLRFTDYLRPLISRWWLIVVAVVVATGGVYFYYARQPNVYTASTLVYVTQPGDPLSGTAAAPPTDRNVNDVASLLGSRATATAVAHNIRYPGTAQDLLGQVSITSKQGEDFINITAQSGTASQAAAIANGFANQFVATLTGAYVTELRSAITLTKAQLAHVSPGPAGEISRAGLTSQLSNLELTLGVPTTVAKQPNVALPPSAPSDPKPVRDALFAFALSLLAAVALVYAIERFDRRLKSPEDFETAYSSPLLAVLPHTDDPAPIRAGKVSLSGDFREPFRVLRTNIELASLDAPPRTIVVSSAMPGEGKSTVVRNLALAFGETGKRVAVVDLDLRHPALARMFAVTRARGITDVLRHDAPVEKAAIDIQTGLPALEDALEVRAGNGRSTGNGAAHTNGHHPPEVGLTLLLTGALPANPPAVLASERLIEVLNDLAERHDIVLIDSAPVLAVTDTVPLLRYADAAVFVGRLGVTTRDTAKRLMEFLVRVPDLNLLGVVANDLTRLEASAYGYGYGYGYGIGTVSEPKRGKRRRKAPAVPETPDGVEVEVEPPPPAAVVEKPSRRARKAAKREAKAAAREDAEAEKVVAEAARQAAEAEAKAPPAPASSEPAAPPAPAPVEATATPAPAPVAETAPMAAPATSPADTTPADATPADMTPADTTPADATPADVADATPADATKTATVVRKTPREQRRDARRAAAAAARAEARRESAATDEVSPAEAKPAALTAQTEARSEAGGSEASRPDEPGQGS
jgi:Mrp family chromosome partitioning ATPase/capsular polysaccharide biosynthesis protein